MLNNSEKKKLVQIANISDEEDDDNIIEYERDNLKERVSNRVSYTNIILTILTILTISIIGHYIYENAAIGTSNFDNLAQDVSTTKEALALSIEPIDIELTSKMETDSPFLPGIYLMNKGYNMISGKPIHEQSGHDIIDYTFNGRFTNDVSGETYEIPLEFRSIPNIEPSCDIYSTVNSLHHSTSTSTLQQEAKLASGGFSAAFDLSAKVPVGSVKVGIDTQIKYGLMFGSSSASKSARTAAENDYTWSFSVDSTNRYYKAEIEWNRGDNEGGQGSFNWKNDFLLDIQSLNNNGSYKSILLFINKWGSHVLTKMQTGSYCKETAFAEGSGSQTDVETFRKEVSSSSFDYIFWSSNREKSSGNARVDTYSNNVQYEFSDIHCNGEVKVTSQSCSALTADVNNPIVLSYQLLPIWEIDAVGFTDETITKIESFFDELVESMQVCGKLHCNNKGICTLNPDIWSERYINDWNGVLFSSLWDDDEYCFCFIDNFGGKHCEKDLECDCVGGTDCCCYSDNTCDTNNICSPTLNICIAKNDNIFCGKDGEFIECSSGIVSAVCGSKYYGSCDNVGICPSKTHTIMQCSYSSLGVVSSTPQWKCAYHGVDNVCDTDTRPLLMGICGSGGNLDCSSKCKGSTGVLCGSINNINIDDTNCHWRIQSDWGQLVECPDGYIGTGFCGSGNGYHCSFLPGINKAAKIRCCPLEYESMSPTLYPSIPPTSYPTNIPSIAPTDIISSDPNCIHGIPYNDICCTISCGQCGGPNCSQRSGGSINCCSTPIRNNGYSCDNNMAPCILSNDISTTNIG